jgi:CubicO group peptidase (beta-lactamase class C family)
MRRLIWSVLATVLVITGGRAQEDALDQFIRGQLRQQRIPGLSLVVIKDGRTVRAQGYGVADLTSKAPATPETVYRIASVSKPFIASAIMRLAQERRLHIDDPISRYLDGTPVSWSKITIRHLLSHTSGLIREGPAFDPNKVRSDADVVRSAYSAPLRFSPGERHEYGNLNYFVLAEIIRTVGGAPWTEFITAQIFKPAGMMSTWPTNTTASIPHRAVGYVDNDHPHPAPPWIALRPSGAFLSTVLDLAKWDAALDAGQILSGNTSEQMWTPARLNDGTAAPYGLGWFVSVHNGRRRVQHTGGMPGARAGFVKYRDDRLTIIVLMNLDDVDIEAILGGIASLYLSGQSQ